MALCCRSSEIDVISLPSVDNRTIGHKAKSTLEFAYYDKVVNYEYTKVGFQKIVVTLQKANNNITSNSTGRSWSLSFIKFRFYQIQKKNSFDIIRMQIIFLKKKTIDSFPRIYCYRMIQNMQFLHNYNVDLFWWVWWFFTFHFFGWKIKKQIDR